jgi:hypothetical protein
VDDDAEEAPSGPIVRLKEDDDGLVVLIEPSLASGHQYPQHFARRDRDFAWQYAKMLWADHRLGFRDETEGNGGRCGPYNRTTEH